MYASIKKGLGVCLATEKKFPYYPMRYFRHQVADWLVTNRQKVMLVKGDYLRQAYGVRDADAQFPGPFSYRDYCKNVLDKSFGGMPSSFTPFPVGGQSKSLSKTLQQYKVRDTAGLQDVDIAFMYNSSLHYTAAGKCLTFFLHKQQVACNMVLGYIWSLMDVA